MFRLTASVVTFSSRVSAPHCTCSWNSLGAPVNMSTCTYRASFIVQGYRKQLSVVRPTSCRAVCIEHLGWWLVINTSYCTKHNQHA